METENNKNINKNDDNKKNNKKFFIIGFLIGFIVIAIIILIVVLITINVLVKQPSSSSSTETSSSEPISSSQEIDHTGDVYNNLITTLNYYSDEAGYDFVIKSITAINSLLDSSTNITTMYFSVIHESNTEMSLYNFELPEDIATTTDFFKYLETKPYIGEDISLSVNILNQNIVTDLDLTNIDEFKYKYNNNTFIKYINSAALVLGEYEELNFFGFYKDSNSNYVSIFNECYNKDTSILYLDSDVRMNLYPYIKNVISDCDSYNYRLLSYISSL